MVSDATDLIAIDALGPDGVYRTRNREPVTAIDGFAIAELSIAPRLYVSRALSAQRGVRPLPLHAAGSRLGQGRRHFCQRVDRGAGLRRLYRCGQPDFRSAHHGDPGRCPQRRRWCGIGFRRDAISPAGGRVTRLAWRGHPHGGAVWARRGDVFAVLASGNGPGVHGLWPQALALGYRVAVRPSRREPLTAHRLVNALGQAGFRPHDAVYLPTDHRGADELIRSADLAMVYGGQDVVDKYAGDPTVFVNGPGRAKILITAEHDWRDYLDVITDSIANLGGVACVNTTAVLYEGDPAPLAAAIAERLSAIEALPTDDERASLPTQNFNAATALAAQLAAVAAGATPLLGADQVVAALSADYAALRPAVHLLAKPDVAKLNVELPFPCVWVSPWSRADGLEPLRHSLVISAITDDEDLIDALLAEPTIANVYGGHHPTHHTASHIPHDGFLADFLMRNKGFIRD